MRYTTKRLSRLGTILTTFFSVITFYASIFLFLTVCGMLVLALYDASTPSYLATSTIQHFQTDIP